MNRISRNERLAAMTRVLTQSPNQIFSLGTFCDLFGTARSTMSEDVDILRDVFVKNQLGTVETVLGSGGGIRFRPTLTRVQALETLHALAQKMMDPTRLLPGNFLYTADLLADPQLMEQLGCIIAGVYYEAKPDFVLTIETKGIPLAMMTARALGVPMVIARKDSKVYEGSSVNINYLSGSGKRVETMCLSRRAVKEGQRALIVDDFMRVGDTARAMKDMMREFGASVVGICVLTMTKEPQQKQVEVVRPLLVIQSVEGTPSICAADWIENLP